MSVLGKNKLTINTTEHEISICTLWMEQHIVKNYCDLNNKYFIIGNLYTQCGITKLIVNVLRNPKIKKIIVLTDQDLQNSLIYY